MIHAPDEAAARENLELGLANEPRTATPLEASAAKMVLMAMRSHRGDGIPTQYVHGLEVAAHAETMWLALLTAIRATSQAELKAGVGEDNARLIGRLRVLTGADVFGVPDTARVAMLDCIAALSRRTSATIRREAFEEAAIVARDAMAALEWPPQDGDQQIDEVLAAIRALSDQPIDDISDTGAEVEREAPA